ncbi:MAG: hypothetical protein M3388_08720 [Acidobacteriota bacterium]|nr:hypothetical protein [Acidobacteriota bacterium]
MRTPICLPVSRDISVNCLASSGEMICSGATRRVPSRSMRRNWLCFKPCVKP